MIPASRIALAAACAAACVHVADDRARRDETIGRAEAAGARIEIDDGLAAVRAFEPGRIALWAGAPGFTGRLTIPDGAPATWELSIRNVMAESVLTLSDPDGAPVAIVVGSTAIPTERAWQLPLARPGDYRVRLRPLDEDDPSPWRFAAFADVQEEIDCVGDVFARMNDDPTLRFVIVSGDLTRRGEAGELDRFQRELERLGIPCYATLGNHELGTRDDLFHDYFGRGNHRFAYRGVQLTLLDSASATLAPVVYDWLDRWLAEGRDRFHVVFMHIPPLDPVGTRNGGFASRNEAHALIGTLARGGVDLTIYGHVHSYYAFENGGIPAFISGGGGAIPERLDGVGRHYLAIDVDPVSSTFETAIVPVD